MSQDDLVDRLIKRGYLKTQKIIEAFRGIDRNDFVTPEYAEESYGDYPLPVGDGQTIAQPSLVAFMFELLQPSEGDIILEVGAGSGWVTAILSEIVGDRGFVYGVELIPELVHYSRDNLAVYGFDNTEIFQASSGLLGLAERGPYDKILVSATGDELSDELIDQLNIGGRMVIPVLDSIIKINKISKDNIKEDRYSNAVFISTV